MFNFFKKKTDENETVAEVDNAVDTKKEQQPKTELEKAIEDAKNGNIHTASHLGNVYHYGREIGDEEYPEGVEPNYSLSIKYHMMAANRGHLKSQVDLGLLYMDDDSLVYNSQEAIKWFHLAAKRGHSFAQYVIGHYYGVGTLLPKDENKSFHWLLESANNGECGGMLELARIYKKKADELLDEEGFSEADRIESWKNAQLCFKWYKKAADLGEEEAMFYTALFYRSGYGVKEDREQGLYYIDLAIENGYEGAIDVKQAYFTQEEV